MPKQEIGRLALRREGEWWNAYYARQDTMEGAFLIGSIRIGIATKSPEIKQAFMDLMKNVVAYGLEEVVGQVPSWNEPQDAPESERAGNA